LRLKISFARAKFDPHKSHTYTAYRQLVLMFRQVGEKMRAQPSHLNTLLLRVCECLCKTCRGPITCPWGTPFHELASVKQCNHVEDKKYQPSDAVIRRVIDRLYHPYVTKYFSTVAERL